jgi:hypothetical protein
MDWKILRERLVRMNAAVAADFTLPPVLLEIQPDFVAAVRLEAAKQQAEVRRVSVAALPPAALTAHSSRPNVTNGDAVREAIAASLEAVGSGNERFGLLISDASARVSVLSLASLPEDPREAERLIRWKLTENLPFPAEEARIHHQVLVREPDHVEVLAVAARGSVLAEYESIFEPANAAPALVLPSTIALLPLVPDGNDLGQLLVHLCCRALTTVLIRGSRVCFWRTREVRPETADVVRDVITECVRVRAASRDQLKLELGEVWFCARPAAPKGLEEELGRVMDVPVKQLRPDPERSSGLSEEEKPNFERIGAVSAGLVQNVGGPSTRSARISLNLASSPTLRDRYALVAAAAVAIVGFIALLFLAHSLWVNYKTFHTLAAQSGRDESERAALWQKDQELRRHLEQPKYSDTYREVKFVNALIAEKKLSAPGLVSKVNDLLPLDVKLTRLTYGETAEGAGVHLEITGKSQTAVDEFVSRLEQSPDFVDPSIATVGLDRQNQPGASGGANLVCHALYRAREIVPNGRPNDHP